MRRNLFILTFGLLAGTLASGCFLPQRTETSSGLANDLSSRKDLVADKTKRTSLTPASQTRDSRVLRTGAKELPDSPKMVNVIPATKTNLPNLGSPAIGNEVVAATTSPGTPGPEGATPSGPAVVQQVSRVDMKSIPSTNQIDPNGPAFQVIQDPTDKINKALDKGEVVWDSHPLQNKQPTLARSAYWSPIEKVESVVDPVLDGQNVYKPHNEMAVPSAPAVVVSKPVANIESQPFGPKDNFQSIIGQVSSFKGVWRLRYSSVDSIDPYGGSVALVGDNLELKEFQVVRVYGTILPPMDRHSPHRYQAVKVEILAGN